MVDGVAKVGKEAGELLLPDKLYFRIGEVAELLGVEPHVLRYWESEFRLRPHRSGSGQRLYRKQDVARFFRVKRLLHEEGYTIAGARKFMQEGGDVVGKGEDAQVGQGVVLEALKQVRILRAEIASLAAEFRR